MSKFDSVYAVLQKPVSEHSRNVFPLEHAHSYSMKAGQITPIKCIHFKPADYFDIKAMDFSITIHLQNTICKSFATNSTKQQSNSILENRQNNFNNFLFFHNL